MEAISRILPHMNALVELLVLTMSVFVDSPLSLEPVEQGSAPCWTILLGLLDSADPIACPSLLDLGADIYLPGETEGKLEELLDIISAVVHARRRLGYPLRRLSVERYKEGMGYVNPADEWRGGPGEHARITTWLDKMRPFVTEMAEWVREGEPEPRVFTPGKFEEQELERAQQYSKVREDDMPWGSL